ncbi:hypothetical protein [Deinococcus sp.]|uniref:hypothetical protein n=1 Tax=Deinococcus sp. TaxID=47478 RepID=UPI0025E7A3F1|nr:hypothetical protein [Deinococcus sp.]
MIAYAVEHAVKLAADAFAHQVAKAIYAHSAVLSVRPHAHWSSVAARIESRVRWDAPVSVLPSELKALAESAGRVLSGIEEVLPAQPPTIQPPTIQPLPVQP